MSLIRSFQLSSKIEFYLAEDGLVTIEIYNLLGEKIKTITDKYYTNGKYEIMLNSDGLKTGVYYCTVKFNGSLVEGKKMIKIE
jgi:serine protease AprX